MSKRQVGTVASVQLHSGKGVMSQVELLKAVAGSGFEGDIKAGRDGRHVLLVDLATLKRHGMQPGQMQEQLTVELEDLHALPGGTELMIGDVGIRITKPAEGCATFAKRCGADDATAFIKKMHMARGMLGEVLTPGAVRAGDPIMMVADGGGH